MSCGSFRTTFSVILPFPKIKGSVRCSGVVAVKALAMLANPLMPCGYPDFFEPVRQPLFVNTFNQRYLLRPGFPFSIFVCVGYAENRRAERP